MIKTELNFIDTPELPKRSERFNWNSVSVAILVRNSEGEILFGHGHYDYDSEHWTYHAIGWAEQDDNNVFAWAYLPDFNKLK